MSLSGFQRRRRLLAAEAAKLEQEDHEDVNIPVEPQEPANGENESQAAVLSPDHVDDMEIERVKELLDQFEVKYAHNTSEAKLREKLKNAIG